MNPTDLANLKQRRNQLHATLLVLDERAAAQPGPMTVEQRQALADAQTELTPLVETIRRLEQHTEPRTYSELLARRAELWAATAALEETLAAEGRAMTPAELRDWDDATLELRTVAGEVERIEHQARIVALGGSVDDPA